MFVFLYVFIRGDNKLFYFCIVVVPIIELFNNKNWIVFVVQYMPEYAIIEHMANLLQWHCFKSVNSQG